MKGLIGQYAVPILEEKSLWGTDAPTHIAYMDTQDIAWLTFIAIRNEKLEKRLLTLAGPHAWTTQEELINLGSRRLIVPGNFPIGCMPIYLTMFGTRNGLDYDMNNCLKGLNKFAMLHNLELKAALQKLRKEYPHVHIMYADYYNAFLYVLKNAQRLGFDLQSSKKACCGSGGSYNFNFTKMCGLNGTSVCSNPSQYISWDGIHLTQRAYKIMARVLMHFGFTHPRY